MKLELCKESSIVDYIRLERLRWIGYIERISDARILNKLMYAIEKSEDYIYAGSSEWNFGEMLKLSEEETVGNPDC